MWNDPLAVLKVDDSAGVNQRLLIGRQGAATAVRGQCGLESLADQAEPQCARTELTSWSITRATEVFLGHDSWKTCEFKRVHTSCPTARSISIENPCLVDMGFRLTTEAN